MNTPQYERHQGSTQTIVEAFGSFTTNGSSAPTVVNGEGFTVSAPATGVYTITFDRKYPGMIVCLADLATADGTATNDEVHAGGYTASTGVLKLTTESAAGTAADLTGPVVNFLVKFVKYEIQL